MGLNGSGIGKRDNRMELSGGWSSLESHFEEDSSDEDLRRRLLEFKTEFETIQKENEQRIKGSVKEKELLNDLEELKLTKMELMEREKEVKVQKLALTIIRPLFRRSNKKVESDKENVDKEAEEVELTKDKLNNLGRLITSPKWISIAKTAQWNNDKIKRSIQSKKKDPNSKTNNHDDNVKEKCAKKWLVGRGSEK
ncbi:hypothetical protein BY996DRAFT_6476411 [Phakopsora pachyrhizi]|nr:hypothetical protein BY996DRAFT_6476411 [Phakopsora pachyrhizi]